VTFRVRTSHGFSWLMERTGVSLLTISSIPYRAYLSSSAICGHILKPLALSFLLLAIRIRLMAKS
jgi:hypothetical protein